MSTVTLALSASLSHSLLPSLSLVSLSAHHAPGGALWLHCDARLRLRRHLWPALAQVFISLRVPLPSFFIHFPCVFFLFYFVILMPANNLIKRFVFSFLWRFFARLSHFICAHTHTHTHIRSVFSDFRVFAPSRVVAAAAAVAVCVIFTLSNMLTFR